MDESPYTAFFYALRSGGGILVPYYSICPRPNFFPPPDLNKGFLPFPFLWRNHSRRQPGAPHTPGVSPTIFISKRDRLSLHGRTASICRFPRVARQRSSNGMLTVTFVNENHIECVSPKGLLGIPRGAGGFYGTLSPGFKSPLLVLCLLSDDSESRGPPGLRADQIISVIQF